MLYRYFLVAIAGFCAINLLAGCSEDKHVFTSTPMQPVTIAIREIPSSKILWEKDVPVQHVLVMKMSRPGDNPPFKVNNLPAKSFEWWLKPLHNQSKIVDQGKVKLPGFSVIIERSHRPAPEYPAGYTPDAPDTPNAPNAPNASIDSASKAKHHTENEDQWSDWD